jgi:putative FmdB family regulatory protein
MPLYEYKCDSCGDVFEVMRKFSDPPLTVHEKCGGPVHRLMSAPSFQFKGTGWYVTDYGKGGKSPAANGGSKNESSGESSKGESSKSGESSSKDGGSKENSSKESSSKEGSSSESNKSDSGSSKTPASSSSSSDKS